MKSHPSLLALNFLTLLLLLFVSSPIIATAQRVVDEKPFEINYYDKDWKLVTDRKKAEYYRHVFKTSDPEKVFVKDFFISGQTQFECFATDYDSRDANKLAMDGTCKWWGEDGRLMEEAVYVLGKRDGLSRERNQFGGFTEGYFVDDAQEGVFNILDADGTLVMRLEYSSGVVGKYVIFPKDGEWTKAYLEVFSDPDEMLSRDWSFTESTNFTENRDFFVELSSDEEIFQMNALGLQEDKVWSLGLAFSFEKVRGKAEGGLVFGANGPDNLVSFTISTDGTFSIAERRNGIERPIIENKRSNLIKKDGKENTLGVARTSTGFSFTINKETVHTQESVRWLGGSAGILSGKGRGQMILKAFSHFAPTEPITDLSIDAPAWWVSTGSGFIFSKDGFVATNNHVIDGALRIEVEVKAGDATKSVGAEVVAFDAASDLAILKIDSSELKHIKEIPFLFKTDLADLGTKVFSLGFPATNILGSEMKFTEGSVSSRTGYKGDATTYQVSAPVTGGSSGSPMFDSEGRLIGIISSLVPDLQNVTYGVKASYLVDMIKSMENGPELPNGKTDTASSQTERIKTLSGIVVFIKVKK